MSRTPWGMPTTLWPSLTISDRPCAVPSVPSVATNGGMPRIATSQPLTVPNAAPTRMAAPSPSSIDWVASDTMATQSEVSVNTAPIDRSSPSVMMISVIGSASMVKMVDCTSTLERFATDRKPAAIAPKIAIKRTSTSATPGMRCRGFDCETTAASRMMHSQSHDVLLRQLRPRQMPGDASLAHHTGPVADVADFDLLGRNHQRRRAFGDQPVDQRKNLGLGADIDAAGRLVENKQPCAGCEPFSDHDLLLIAAGQQADRLPRARRRDPELPDQAIGGALRAARIEHAARKQLSQCRHHEIVADRTQQREPLALAALRDQRDAAARGDVRFAGDRLAIENDLAGGHGIGAENGSRDFAASRADQPAQADDLALADLDVNVGNAGRRRQAFDFKQHFAPPLRG